MTTLQTAIEVYSDHILKHGSVRAAATAWRARAFAKTRRRQYENALTDVATDIHAYVNHGRWLVDCVCGNGVPVDRVDGPAEAVCFSCGAVWTGIVFPDERREIETLLTTRRWDTHQNWKPGETVDKLQRENDEHRGALRKER